jgi:hypothetical protein
MEVMSRLLMNRATIPIARYGLLIQVAQADHSLALTDFAHTFQLGGLVERLADEILGALVADVLWDWICYWQTASGAIKIIVIQRLAGTM